MRGHIKLVENIFSEIRWGMRSRWGYRLRGDISGGLKVTGVADGPRSGDTGSSWGVESSCGISGGSGGLGSGGTVATLGGSGGGLWSSVTMEISGGSGGGLTSEGRYRPVANGRKSGGTFRQSECRTR